METSPWLPQAGICRTEKFIASADYWICLVAAPDPCPYLLKIGSSRICSAASKSGAQLKRKIEDKKISVRFPDASLGLVPRARLHELIETGGITAFRRTSGWVDVTRDPIRKSESSWRFKGLQRRAGRSF